MVDKTQLHQRKTELLAELRIINKELRKPDAINFPIFCEESGVSFRWHADKPLLIYAQGSVDTTMCFNPERGFSCSKDKFFKDIDAFRKQVEKATS